jgi:hypothetical protein
MSKETNKTPKWIKDAVAEAQEQAKFWLRLIDEDRLEECEFQVEVFINYLDSKGYYI